MGINLFLPKEMQLDFRWTFSQKKMQADVLNSAKFEKSYEYKKPLTSIYNNYFDFVFTHPYKLIYKKSSCQIDKLMSSTFLSTFSFWSWHKTSTSHFLGQRSNFGVIKINYHIETLKKVIKFSNTITGDLLFVSDKSNQHLDGLVKFFALKANQQFYIGKWQGGFITKSKKIHFCSIFIINSAKNIFVMLEAKKIGLPIILICSGKFEINYGLYPLFCNNGVGLALFYILFVISNAIIEGILVQVLIL